MYQILKEKIWVKWMIMILLLNKFWLVFNDKFYIFFHKIYNMNKILVLFVFHIYNDRVKSFFTNCIFDDDNVDFIIIYNNTSTIDFELPKNKNVMFLFRENIGYDFGGWSDALLKDNLYEKYNYFIFVNSSVVGPFIPSYYKEKWTSIFIDGLKDNVKLFGSTINTCYNPIEKSHVQSYIFSMDKNTLQYLIDCDIFSITNYAKSFHEAIWNKEVLMSRKIIDNGWNIGCLFPQYKNIDFTFKTKQPHEYNMTFFDDATMPYFKHLWNEYQLVFIKGNRINLTI